MYTNLPSAILWGVLLSIPAQALVVPCADGKCSPNSLSLRAASPVVIPPVAPKAPPPKAPIRNGPHDTPDGPPAGRPIPHDSPDGPDAVPRPRLGQEGKPVANGPDGAVCKRAGACFPYPEAQRQVESGAAKYNRLVEFNKTPKDQITDPPLKNLPDHYDGMNVKQEAPLMFDEDRLFITQGGTPENFDDTAWLKSEIINKPGDKPDDSIMTMYANPKEGAIFIDRSFNREHDKTKAMKQSDMMRAIYNDAAKKQKVPDKDLDIKTIVRYNIIKDDKFPKDKDGNDRFDAQTSMNAVWEIMGKPKEKIVLKPGAAEGTPEAQAWNLMADTVHVDRPMYLMQDGAKKYGKHDFEQIEVFVPGMKNGAGFHSNTPTPPSKPSTPEGGGTPEKPGTPEPPAKLLPEEPKLSAGGQGGVYAFVLRLKPVP